MGRITIGIMKLRSDGTFTDLNMVTGSLLCTHPILYSLNMGILLHAYCVSYTFFLKKSCDNPNLAIQNGRNLVMKR